MAELNTKVLGRVLDGLAVPGKYRFISQLLEGSLASLLEGDLENAKLSLSEVISCLENLTKLIDELASGQLPYNSPEFVTYGDLDDEEIENLLAEGLKRLDPAVVAKEISSIDQATLKIRILRHYLLHLSQVGTDIEENLTALGGDIQAAYSELGEDFTDKIVSGRKAKALLDSLE